MAIVTGFKINKEVMSQVIKVEIEREGGGKLNKDVFEAIGELSDKMLGVKAGHTESTVGSEIKREAITGLREAFNNTNAYLKAGFPGASSGYASSGWSPLSKKWIKRKKPESRDLFWRNKGDLNKGFITIAQDYLAQLESSKSVIKTRTRLNTYGRKKFSYELKLTLAQHSEDYFNKITRDSFVSGIAHEGTGSSSGTKDAYAIIGYLEGVGKTHRPFIAKLFSIKGLSYQRRLTEIIERHVARAGKLKL